MQQPILEKSAKKIPADIICPITSQIMTDPVMLVESGNTYERESILQWLQKNSTDPLTAEKIMDKTIAPNRAVKRLIINFLEELKTENPDIIQDTYLPEGLKQDLVTALEKNDVKVFTDALSKDNRLLTEYIKDNKNIWMLTCEMGSLEILTIILEKLSEKILSFEAVQADKGLSLFLTVSQRLGMEAAKLLVKAFQWNSTDIQHLLDQAVKDNNLAIASIALSLGATGGVELLNQSYQVKQTEMLKLLVLAGGLIQAKDDAGNDFLLRSIQEGYSELSLFLISKGSIAPNTQNIQGETALHTAVYKNQIEVVKALLNHSEIDRHQIDGKKDTALQTAVRQNHLEMTALLIGHQLEINLPTTTPEDAPLAIAYQNKCLDMQKLLIRSGAQIGNLLVEAIADDQMALIEFLLTDMKEQVDVNKLVSGKSPLMLAIEKNQLKTVMWLLAHPKIEIHQVDADGNKALHYAALMGNQTIIKSLMEKGLSIKDKNKAKETPLQLCQKKNAATALWMEQEHRAKKVIPFLAPLQEEITSLKAENAAQKTENGMLNSKIEQQQIEIERLKQSLVLESKKTETLIQKNQTELQSNFSFFTAERKEMIVSKTEKMQEKERQRLLREQRRREEEKRQRLLEEQRRQEQLRQDIQDTQALLKWATEGHLVEVEKLMQKNPKLALATGTVKDLSDRTFNNITALQYAAWALDSEMCEVILKYLEPEQASMQFKALSNEPHRYSAFGACYDMEPLITKTQTYLDNYDNWDDAMCYQYWQKKVGGEQRKCPAWLIYAWCEEGNNTAWVRQDFINYKVARDNDFWLNWWFTDYFNNGRGVGSTWAVMRGLWAIEFSSNNGSDSESESENFWSHQYTGSPPGIHYGSCFDEISCQYSCMSSDHSSLTAIWDAIVDTKNIQSLMDNRCESLRKLKASVAQNLENTTFVLK